MSMPTRFNPRRPALRLDPFASIEELFRGLPIQTMRDFDIAPTQMRIDVQEEGGAYRVEMEVPGVAKDDIEITIDGNQVTVQAGFRNEHAETKGKSLYTERYNGHMSRSFGLPQEIDEARCDAQYENGVLRLTLAKKAAGQAKRIAVQ